MTDSGQLLIPHTLPKKKKKKKPTTTHHKSAAHPPYFQMIKEAITALDQRSGSSPYAIANHIESQHKSLLPSNFRKILRLQLKNSAARGKLIKIKASYKLSQQKSAARRTPITRAARANAAKQTEERVTRRRRSSRSKSVNQMEAAAVKATARKLPKSIRSKAKNTVVV